MTQNEAVHSQYLKARNIAKWKVIYVWLQSIGLFLWSFLVTVVISGSIIFATVLSFIILLIHYNSTELVSSLEIYVSLAFLVIFTLPLVPYFVLGRKLWKNYKKSLDLSHLDELPLKMNELIKARIDILSERMSNAYQTRLAKHQIKLLYEKRNFTALPSMVFSKNNINIIIPLGYLKTIKSDPESADAILAHELAHFFHNDSNLLLKIRCYYQIKHLWKHFIPFLVIASILNSVVLQMYLITFINILYDVRLVPDFMVLLVSIPLHFLSDLILKYIAYKKLLQKVYERVLDAEILADLFAITITSPESLRRFLKTNIKNPSSWNALHPSLDSKVINIYHDIWNSLHPTLSDRVTNINSSNRLTNK